MLTKENFNESHIRMLQKQSKKDPALLERAVFAFGLLEAIRRVEMPFIFKGGTCLILLLKHPMRLSTDIDIFSGDRRLVSKFKMPLFHAVFTNAYLFLTLFKWKYR